MRSVSGLKSDRQVHRIDMYIVGNNHVWEDVFGDGHEV